MNLLVTGAFAWTENEINKLKQLGHEIVFMQQESDILPCDYEWVEGIIGNGIFLKHSINKFTSLKYIQLTSAGLDRVPMDYVKLHNIKLHNAHGVYSIPMAEFALCGVLELYKQSRFFWNNQKRHKWIKHRGIIELNGKTVSIIGCGSVGTECAKIFKAFNCNVIGVDIYPYQSDYYCKMFLLSELDNVLNFSDIVILALPLTRKTHYIINDMRLKIMKPGSILVNISRGAVIDSVALSKAVQTHLMGAVLDVFEEEPIDEKNELWDMENVIITPHNSFVGDGNHERMWNVIYENLEVLK